MLDFPPPPPPPVDASQLENLADYYRSLADYYRRASALAAQQLAHVEALLSSIKMLAISGENKSCWLETTGTQKNNDEIAYSQGFPMPQLSATSESHQSHLPTQDSSEKITSQTLSEQMDEDDYDEPDEILFDFLPIQRR